MSKTNEPDNTHLKGCPCFQCETRGRLYTWQQFDDEYRKGPNRICKHCNMDARSHGGGTGNQAGRCQALFLRSSEQFFNLWFDKKSWFEAK